MINFDEYITWLNEYKYALLLGLPEIQSCFVFLQDSDTVNKHHEIIFLKEKKYRITYITEADTIIDKKWFCDIFERRIKNGSMWELSEEDKKYFIIYYGGVYLRKSSIEFKLIQAYFEMSDFNAMLTDLKEYMIKENYSASYQYSNTRYLDKNCYKSLNHWSRMSIYKYYIHKCIEITYKKKARRLKQKLKNKAALECPISVNNLIGGQLVSSVEPLKMSNSASGCWIYKISIDNGTQYFLKCNEIEDLDTIYHEKIASRKLTDGANHKQYYLRDYSKEDDPYLIFDFHSFLTLNEVSFETKSDMKFQLSLINFLIEVLDDLYKCQIIHRDIREDNISVYYDGSNYKFYLLDFGCCVFDECVPELHSCIQRENYYVAGVNSRAGVNVWDDVCSAIMICERIIPSLKYNYPAEYNILVNKIGRYCLFEMDDHL